MKIKIESVHLTRNVKLPALDGGRAVMRTDVDATDYDIEIDDLGWVVVVARKGSMGAIAIPPHNVGWIDVKVVSDKPKG
jgi:hypothetical protein